MHRSVHGERYLHSRRLSSVDAQRLAQGLLGGAGRGPDAPCSPRTGAVQRKRYLRCLCTPGTSPPPRRPRCLPASRGANGLIIAHLDYNSAAGRGSGSGGGPCSAFWNRGSCASRACMCAAHAGTGAQSNRRSRAGRRSHGLGAARRAARREGFESPFLAHALNHAFEPGRLAVAQAMGVAQRRSKRRLLAHGGQRVSTR